MSLKQIAGILERLQLTQAYQDVMAENIEKGFVEEIKDAENALLEKDCHYLPHFFVLKDSETTPLRTANRAVKRDLFVEG